MQYAVRCKNYVRGEKFRNSLELGFNKQRRRSYGGLTLSSVGELGDQVLTTEPGVLGYVYFFRFFQPLIIVLLRKDSV